MTTALDEGIGRILDAVEASGRAHDTLVWFLNDNGGLPPLASNAPLRGGKGDLLEGGIRVPSLLRWPAALPAGSYPEPVSIVDVLPTLVAAAGETGMEGKPLDGVDLVPHLKGERNAPPHDALYWRFDTQRAIRRAGWKWIEGKPGTAGALFDLGSDPGETHDRSEQEPERVAELRARLDAWTQTLGPARPDWAPAPSIDPGP
jgi:arylsulfatase A-like enzyme